jgi:hypothetical protein
MWYNVGVSEGERDMWTKMFLRLLMQMTYGVSFEDAVKTVATSSPDFSETEVRLAAIAARAQLEREKNVS